MNKYTIFILLFLIAGTGVFAQVGINNDGTQPDPSAMLDVKSTSKGLLAPRVALTAINSPLPIASPATGLLVYNTVTAGTPPNDVTTGYYCWNGTKWLSVLDPEGSNLGDMQYWNGVKWITIPAGLPGQFLQMSTTNIPMWMGATYPVITTYSATNITASSAMSGGSISSDGGSSITAKGVCYNTSPAPTIANLKVTGGTGTGSFSSSLTGLLAGTLYYVRAYATNSAGTAYGNEISFTTVANATIPLVTTTAVTSITATTANSGGTVNNAGGATVTARGVCWGVSPNPTIANSKTSNGTGTGGFVSSLTSLTPNTLYYLRAYATNSVGTGYGNELSFTTACSSYATVSLTIAASANPVCVGTTVTFTATPTNGGSSPTFLWKVNGATVTGATNVTYTYVPINNDAVTCVLTSNAPCVNGNPATSNSVTMTVNPLLPVSVAIAASANPVNPGTTVTFNATPINGGSTPGYQWKVNNVNVGTNSPTYSYVPANNDSIQCILTSNLACISGSPAISNIVIMTLNTMGFPCPGTPTVTYGGQTYNTVKIGDQCWLRENLNYGNRINGSQEQTNNGVIEKYCYNDLESNCNVYGGLYQWNEMMQYITVEGIRGICPTGWHLPTESEWNILLDNQGGSGSAGASIKEAGVLHWNAPNANATNSSGFTALPGGFRADIASFGAISNYGHFWTSTEFAELSGLRKYLSYDQSAVMTSTLSKSYALSVRCLKDTCTSYSNAGISIGVSSNPVCAGTSVTFTAIPVNGGTTPIYQWKVNGLFVGTNSSTYTYGPFNGDIITCDLTLGATCSLTPVESNSITMTVNPVPVISPIWSNSNGGGISQDPSQTVCLSNQAYFIDQSFPGTTYTWSLSGGGTIVSGNGSNSIEITWLMIGGPYLLTVFATVDGCLGLPQSKLVTVVPQPVGPTLMSTSTSYPDVCDGSMVWATFNPGSGGVGCTDEFDYGYDDSGTFIPYIPGMQVPTTGHTMVTMRGRRGSCGTSLGCNGTEWFILATWNVILPLPVSVSITASANPVNTGTSVTFTATPVNGGAIPSYQWKVNGVNVGTNTSSYSYIPVNGDSIKCILTSSLTCITGNPVTSNLIMMVVNSMGVPCPGTPTVTYGGQTYNTVKIGEQCWLKENLNIGTRINGVQEQTNNGAIEKYCYADLESNCEVYGGLYQWNEMMQYVNIEGGNGICPNGWHLPSDAEWCQLTSFIDPSVLCSGTGYQGYNAGNKMKEVGTSHWISPNSGADNSSGFTALPSGHRPAEGGFDDLTTDANFWSSTIFNTDVVWYWYLTNDVPQVIRTRSTKPLGFSVRCLKDTCSTYSSTGVSIGSSNNPVCAGTSVTYTATPTNGGTTPFYQWEVNGGFVGTNSSTYSYIPANGDSISCIMTSSVHCSSNPASSNMVIMTVNSSASTPTSGTHTPSPTQIIWNWNSVTGATGYKWSATNDYSSATDMGTATTKTETGLNANTSYTRYVWAYNSCGASLATTLTSQTTVVIGQNYGGGIVFYIYQPGDIGYVAGQTHGLIASQSSQGTAPWGCTNWGPSTSTAIGTGQGNTSILVGGCSEAGIAARICSDLVLNGYDDWFLPSKDELYQIYLHQNVIGGFSNNYYWSSSGKDGSTAWGQYFPYSNQGNYYKYQYYWVHAIRTF